MGHARGRLGPPGSPVGTSGYASFLPAGGHCTADFIFADAAQVYIGTAAHCFGDNDLGTQVAVGERDRTLDATLAYSSWRAMDLTAQQESDLCNGRPDVSLSTDPRCWDDFALLAVAPADVGRLNPAALGLPGPTGVGAPPAPGTVVSTYGDSPVRAAVADATHARSGPVLDATDQRLIVHTGIPSTEGDSGAPVVTADGRAVGVVVYLLDAPPSSNGVAALPFLLQRAAAAGVDVRLVPAA